MSSKEKITPEEIDWRLYPNCYALLKDLIMDNTIEIKPVPEVEGVDVPS